MTTRIYHGEIEPRQIANNLSAEFHRGNYQVQQMVIKTSWQYRLRPDKTEALVGGLP